MKRFITALVFCFLLLVSLSLFLFPPVEAKENPLLTLLNLPAPPPTNPLVDGRSRSRDQKFFDKTNPPADNAPLGELLDYWTELNNNYREVAYNPKPSDRNLERIFAEIEKDPDMLTRFLNIFPEGARSSDFVKGVYDREGANGAFDRDERVLIKRWLMYHSPYYSSELERIALQAGDSNEYVTNQEEVLALARVDFNRAKSLIDRLYGSGPDKVSQVLAKWALYRHALDADSFGDIERYRDELKAVVEDKSASPGMRDLAFDALCKEKEWSGRDDWYYTLLADKTLADLKVNGSTYTGLTTLLLYAPDDRYVDKMLELVKSDDQTIRTAAVKNLVLKIDTGNPAILKALLPWLEDPEWAVDNGIARQSLIRQLGEHEMPESVPGLIKVLDEKQIVRTPVYGSNTVSGGDPNGYPANAMANVARAMADAANAAARAANAVATYSAANRAAADYYAGSRGVETTTYPHRYLAVAALTKQKDPRAITALRRILPDGEQYERGNVVKALLVCGGFTVAEQLDALDLAARGIRDETEAEGLPAPSGVNIYSAANSIQPYTNEAPHRRARIMTPFEIKALLSQQLQASDEITDELARAIVSRIESLDKKEPALAAAYRRMILSWQNAAINMLLLSDLKRGVANADTIVRLLSQRKALRETQSADVFDIRTGKPVAVGISACLIEDPREYDAILESGDTEARTAMLACARMIRAPLAVAKVAENLKSPNELLQTAAERYLESEDSPTARTIVLSRHPNEAMILGATTAFYVAGAPDETNEHLALLYQSLGDNSLYNGWEGSSNDGDIRDVEKSLQTELKKDNELTGIYAYEHNYIRMYKDRAIFSWDEDASRYRERPLTKEEFDEIKAYLAANRADELAPFLTCGGAYCLARELIMVGRNGGRRVYMNGGYDVNGGRGYDFFAGLEKYFASLKQTRGVLKYALSRDIPGLEIVMASDNLHAETVWKEGSDLRVAASDLKLQKKAKAGADGDDDEPVLDAANDVEEVEQKLKQAEKLRLESLAWYRVTDGDAAGVAEQPPMVEFIPVHDGLAIQPNIGGWRARAAGIEIRSSDDGLFKVARGALSKLRSGFYQDVVITPDGRWAVAYKAEEDGTEKTVRIDLVTKREYPITVTGYGTRSPAAFVPMLGKVLLVRNDNYDYDAESSEDDDIVPEDADPAGMVLVDAATGATQEVSGEFRPLSQQTFRPLQKTAKQNEFWAAIPDSEKNETQVGLYNTRTFSFTPLLRVPKIRFNSMNMWVDEPGGKIYFVYRGHVLSLPIP